MLVALNAELRQAIRESKVLTAHYIIRLYDAYWICPEAFTSDDNSWYAGRSEDCVRALIPQFIAHAMRIPSRRRYVVQANFDRGRREDIVRDMIEGGSATTVAARHHVSLRYVYKLWQNYRATGVVAEGNFGMSGRRRCLSNEQLRIAQTVVAAHPDATIDELCRLLEEVGGLRVSCTYMWRLRKQVRAVDNGIDHDDYDDYEGPEVDVI
jgi:transposase